MIEEIFTCDIHKNENLMYVGNVWDSDYKNYKRCPKCLEMTNNLDLGKFESEGEKYNKSISVLEEKLGTDGLYALFELLKNKYFKEQL